MTPEQPNSSVNYSNTNTSLTRSNSMSRLVAIEQYMSIYGPFVLTTLGIIGNVLSILIFLSPRYRRQSSHFYLLSLALSDLCFLIINLIEDTFRNHNQLYQSRINILDRSSLLVCISVQYARNVTRLLSSWIIVSFTIERLLVVFYPLKRAIICRRKIARFVVFILFVLSLLSNINVPFHYAIIRLSNNPHGEQTICDILPTSRQIYMRFAIGAMISVYLVPMCIIGFVNMLICCKLWRKSFLTEKDAEPDVPKPKHRSRCLWDGSDLLSCFHSSKSKSLEQSSRTRTSSITQYPSVGPLIINEANGHLLRDEIGEGSKSCTFSVSSSSVPYPLVGKQSSTSMKTYIQSRTNRVTMTLLLVSCSFLLLNSPYCAVWIANYAHDFSNATLKSVKEITELFMLTNFCINFLLYCVSGKVFRGELVFLLRCRWRELYDRNEIERLAYRRSRPKPDIQMHASKSQHTIRNLNYQPSKK